MTALLLDYPALRWVFLLLLFAAVALASYTIAALTGQRGAARERLVNRAMELGDRPIPTTAAATLRSDATQGLWLKVVGAIEKSGIPLVDTRDHTLRSKLISAGYDSPAAPRAYSLIRLAMVLGLPALLFLLLWLTGLRPGIVKLYVEVMVAAGLGLYAPALFVLAKAARRRQDIVNGFPDALDLMLVCVEAGLGLEAAFARVGMEMTRSHPLLSEQLGTVVLELRAGRSREDALRRMADRAGVDEIRAFATLLIQSTKLGSSIGQTLRIYAAEMREKRRMRAEEKAHRLPVLLSIPLVACMLPVMIGVLMLPAVIRTVRVLLPALAGHD